MGFLNKKKNNTPPAVANRIKNILGIRKLETMPMQAAKAFQLASDPKAKASDFIEIIESDEALSSKVVKIANSVYFFRGQNATDIEKAVANIGLKELRCMLSANMLKSMLSSKHKIRKQIWANSIGVAIGSRILSSYTKDISDSEAFLCGLVHDIGKLVMIKKNGDLYEKVINIVGSGEKNFIEAEEQIFETNHIEVGKWIAEEWHFPEVTKVAITKHHNPWPKEENLKGKNTPIEIIVKASDIISHSLGLGHKMGMSGLKLNAKKELHNVWGQFEIEESLGEDLLKSFLKQFKEEANLYESKI